MAVSYAQLNQANEAANKASVGLLRTNPQLAAHLRSASSPQEIDRAVQIYRTAGGTLSETDLAYLGDVKRNRAAADVMQTELDRQLENPEKETPHFDQEGSAEAGAMGLLGGAIGEMVNDIRGKKESDQQGLAAYTYGRIVEDLEKQRARDKKSAAKAWRANRNNGTLWERRRISNKQILEKLSGFTPIDEVNWRYGSLDGSQKGVSDVARERFLAQYGPETDLGKSFRELESKRFGLVLGRDARLRSLKNQIEAHANARILAESKGKTLQERFDSASNISKQIHEAEVNKFLSRIPEKQRERVKKHMQAHYANFLQRQQYKQLFSFKGLQTFFKNRPNFFFLLQQTFFGMQQRIPNVDLRSVNPPSAPNSRRGLGSLFRNLGGKGKSSIENDVAKGLAKKFPLQITIALGVILFALLLILLINALIGDMSGGAATRQQESNFLFTCSDPATADLSVDDIAKNFKANYGFMLDMSAYTGDPNQKQVALLIYNSFCELFSNPEFSQIFWNSPQLPLIGEIVRPHIQPVSSDFIKNLSHDSGDYGYISYGKDKSCDGYFVKEPGSSIIKDAKTTDLYSLHDSQSYYLVLVDMNTCPGGAAQAEFIVAQKMSLILANMYFHEHKSEDQNFQNSVVNVDGLLPLVGCKGTQDPKTIDGNTLYTCFADTVAEYFLYNSTIGTINAANYADGLATTLIKNCPNPETSPKNRKASEGWVIDSAKFDTSYPENDYTKCIAGIYPSVVAQSITESVTNSWAGYHLQCVGFAQAAAAGMLSNNTITHPLGGAAFAKDYITEYQSSNPPSTLFRFVKNDGNIQPGDIALYDWGTGGHIDVVTAVTKDPSGVVRYATAGASGGDCGGPPDACSPDYYYSYGTVYRGKSDLVTDPNLAGWLVPTQQSVSGQGQ